jgi:hypothetical protein
VNQTCINGPQWFMRDFADKVEEAENTGVAASSEKVPAEVSRDKATEMRLTEIRLVKIRFVEIRTSERGRSAQVSQRLPIGRGTSCGTFCRRPWGRKQESNRDRARIRIAVGRGWGKCYRAAIFILCEFAAKRAMPLYSASAICSR